MHLFGIITFDEMRIPAAAAEELLELFTLHAGKDGRVGDLVAVEVQDRQHGAVALRVKSLSADANTSVEKAATSAARPNASAIERAASSSANGIFDSPERLVNERIRWASR